MVQHIPSILLVGAGKFGEQHLIEWQSLEKAGKAKLAGIVVNSDKSCERLKQKFNIPITTKLTTKLLSSVDAVDIVTPSSTHFKLIMKCLPHTHVLVEKPVAQSKVHESKLIALASKTKNKLFVGHLFRFHPVVVELKKMINEHEQKPILIQGTFTNPYEERDPKLDLNLDFMHYFDITDFILNKTPKANSCTRNDWVNRISLQYPGKIAAIFNLGWQGDQRTRVFEVLFPDRSINCNFADNTISIKTKTDSWLKVLPPELVALRTELETFLDVIAGKKREYVNLKTASRVIDVAIASRPKKPPKNPKIAVIGGGIYGTSCAAQLAKLGEVTLFESNDKFITQASYNNQWRHHAGFHYARSDETIYQINRSKEAFESVYEAAIDRSVDSYFCTAKSAEIITKERYLSACKSHDLPFEIKNPPTDFLNLDNVSLSILTNESIYNLEKLREIATKRIVNNQNIEMRLNTLVTSGKIADDGQKMLMFKDESGKHSEAFDYVVNTTYAGRNLFSKWFGFAKAPLRYDLFELPVVEIPGTGKVSVTVLDGPFCALISNAEDGMFSLSHIHESLLLSTVTEDGLPPKIGTPKSNWHNIIKHCQQYFPILSKARYIGSRYGLRTIYAYQNDGRVVDYDGRPTVVSNHGFGCWSILAGKIISSEQNAKDLFMEIEKEIKETSKVS